MPALRAPDGKGHVAQFGLAGAEGRRGDRGRSRTLAVLSAECRVSGKLLIMCRKLGTPPGFWVERARELFAAAFARTWPVEEVTPTHSCDEAEAPRTALMGKK